MRSKFRFVNRDGKIVRRLIKETPLADPKIEKKAEESRKKLSDSIYALSDKTFNQTKKPAA